MGVTPLGTSTCRKGVRAGQVFRHNSLNTIERRCPRRHRDARKLSAPRSTNIPGNAENLAGFAPKGPHGILEACS